MAAEAKQYRYADAVYGNVAYDYNSTAAPDVLPHQAEEAPPLEEPRVRERKRVREQEQPQTAFGVPVLAILGGVAVAAMMVFMLLGYVKLAQLSNEKAKLEGQISQLAEQNARLKITYESTFNMSEVERYAVNVLGMTKLADKDATVFQLEKGDRAEILNEDDTRKGILDWLSELVETISEYFG